LVEPAKCSAVAAQQHYQVQRQVGPPNTAFAKRDVQDTVLAPSTASAMHILQGTVDPSNTASAMHSICHAQHLPCTMHKVQGKSPDLLIVGRARDVMAGTSLTSAVRMQICL